MAYDRYDRDERSRWSSNDRSDQNWRGDNRGHRDERGFWDRASDEVSSWFGDEDAERRRRQDARGDERMSGNRDRWQSRDRERDQGRSGEHSAFGRGWGDSDRDYDRGYGRNYDRDRAEYNRDQSSYGGSRSDRDFNYDRGMFNRGGSSERDYNRNWRGNVSSDRNRERDYRPMTGDYGREGQESDQFFAASGYGRNDYGRDRDRDDDRSQSPYGRDQYRRTSWAGSREENPDHDPHYRNWRDRHMSNLDRDYDDYRREHQSKFENDFTGWREKRQNKRGLLGEIREHMEVVGDDGKHVGTVDKTAGDRVILTKSDQHSGGVHHSLSCSDIDKVEGDKVMLDCSADEAKKRWRNESRDRALFERDDQGEMGPRNLNRSFEGTYR